MAASHQKVSNLYRKLANDPRQSRRYNEESAAQKIRQGGPLRKRQGQARGRSSQSLSVNCPLPLVDDSERRDRASRREPDRSEIASPGVVRSQGANVLTHHRSQRSSAHDGFQVETDSSPSLSRFGRPASKPGPGRLIQVGPTVPKARALGRLKSEVRPTVPKARALDRLKSDLLADEAVREHHPKPDMSQKFLTRLAPKADATYRARRVTPHIPIYDHSGVLSRRRGRTLGTNNPFSWLLDVVGDAREGGSHRAWSDLAAASEEPY